MVGEDERVLQLREYSFAQVVVDIVEQLPGDGGMAQRADQQLLEAFVSKAVPFLKEFSRS